MNINTNTNTNNILPNYTTWNINSWKSKSISQQPAYKDKDFLTKVIEEINSFEGITNSNQIDELLNRLSHSDVFILTLGDCCEPFEESTQEITLLKCAFLTLISDLLYKKLNFTKEIVTIGRIAGQYAKPRSSDYEELDGKEYLSFRGQIVNDVELSKREPNPQRLIEGYKVSKKVKDYINTWNQYRKDYQEVLSQCKKDWNNHIEQEYNIGIFNKNTFFSEIFTSHEGLLLDYESALTKRINNDFYVLSADMLWIGERTNQKEEAHIEFFKGVKNPIGIKVSSKANLTDLIEKIKVLNENNQLGKVLLITRLGFSEDSKKTFQNIVKSVKDHKLNVLFICDPMHGNIKKKGSNKVRNIRDIIGEIDFVVDVLNENQLKLNGIHLESTPFDVTECIDDVHVDSIDDLKYTSLCDPRLNFNQTIDVIMKSKI